MHRYLILYFLLATSCFGYQHTPAVIVTKVTENLFNPSVMGVGTFVAYNDVTLKSEIRGRIDFIHFKEGNFAERNQKLFTFYNVEQQAKVKKAEANLRRDQNILKRKQNLAAKKFVSLQDIEGAETQVESSKAELALAKAELEKTTVRAPFDGALSEKKVAKGAYLIEGDPLVRIQDITPIRLKFSLPQKNITTIKVGNKVFATTDVYPNVSFEGKVDAIEPAVDEETKSIHVFATFSNEDKRLIPGLYARAELKTSTVTKSSLFIPEQALVIRPTGNYVFKKTNNTAQLVKVTLGQRMADQAEILSGLQKNDIIILEGQEKIRDGTLINAVEKP